MSKAPLAPPDDRFHPVDVTDVGSMVNFATAPLLLRRPIGLQRQSERANGALPAQTVHSVE